LTFDFVLDAGFLGISFSIVSFRCFSDFQSREIISVEGFRQDGRKVKEVRKIECKLGGFCLKSFRRFLTFLLFLSLPKVCFLAVTVRPTTNKVTPKC
jgi:hypothetical protein